MINWHLEILFIKDLLEHSKNPRQISKQQHKHLTDLIAKFGLIEKPIINLDKTIIGGHQRIKILKKQKIKEIECWIPDRQLDDQEVDRLCIGLNLNQGSWDWDILSESFEVNELLQWGFNEDQLMGIFSESDKSTKEKDEKQKKMKMCPSCGHEF